VRAVLFAALLIASPGSARQVTIDRPSLSAEAAKAAMAACESYAHAHGWAVTIAVIDAGGDPLAFLRMDGAPRVTIDFANGKARTALLMKAPSDMPLKLLEEGKTQVLAWGLLPATGGLPIELDGKVIGAIGASGETGGHDVDCARAGVEAVSAMRAAR